jgi:hypothetical protein
LILHVYHCALAILRDYRTSGGRNRPTGTGKWPPRPNQADIRFLPPTNGFDDRGLGQLLELFQRIDLDDPELDSPIWINWAYLERKLGLARPEVDALIAKARALGLMERLTIDYDHERWMKHSRDKGCLVVMTGVEESDLARPIDEITAAYCATVDELVQEPPPRGLVGPGQYLRNVYVVPNGHLNPRSGPGLEEWKEALALLQALPAGLGERGYDVTLNSYGYEKLIQLAINAHKRGYCLRVI